MVLSKEFLNVGRAVLGKITGDFGFPNPKLSDLGKSDSPACGLEFDFKYFSIKFGLSLDTTQLS
jgi:hypothetical protein